MKSGHYAYMLPTSCWFLRLLNLQILKMEATCSSEASAFITDEERILRLLAAGFMLVSPFA
jgi:hypothetical protein